MTVSLDLTILVRLFCSVLFCGMINCEIVKIWG